MLRSGLAPRTNPMTTPGWSCDCRPSTQFDRTNDRVLRHVTARIPRTWQWKEDRIMVLAIVLIVLAVLLGLGGLVFTALKWLLVVAVVLLIAGAVAGFLARGKSTSVR